MRLFFSTGLSGPLAAVLFVLTTQTIAAETVTLDRVGYDRLSGWKNDGQAAAIAVFKRSCAKLERTKPSRSMGSGRGTVADWMPTCRAARDLPASIGDSAARQFFERNFVPFAISARGRDHGLFTGYFEPELEGSLKPGNGYDVPIYPVPKDLVTFPAGTRRHASAANLPRGRIVDGIGYPYFTRGEIDRGAIARHVRPILYLRDKVDAFFLHVQGSGRVRLPDGRTFRVGFAAKTGLPYTSIGAVLGKSGALPHGGISMQTIKAWLYANPDKADRVLWENRSYIFFRSLDGGDPSLGPPGAQGVPLTPARSLAIDHRLHGYGTPLWLETTMPAPDGQSEKPFRRLMVAQDTGTAITGAVRGDIFWGAGDRAGLIAGLMKHRGRMFALLPKAVAVRIQGR